MTRSGLGPQFNKNWKNGKAAWTCEMLEASGDRKINEKEKKIKKNIKNILS